MAKILLVEDNEMNRDMLSRRLQRKGYEVVLAVDGGEGVAMAHSHAPDLILMDMSLPVLDGWEATRKLKAAPETAGIPVMRSRRTRWRPIARKLLKQAAMITIRSLSSCPGCSARSRPCLPERRGLRPDSWKAHPHSR
jgi:response regulator RpfG family c-di-GMP phosphodiesterase